MRKLSEAEISILIKCSAGIATDDEVKSVISWKASPEEFESLLDEYLQAGNHHGFSAIFWHMPREVSKSQECLLYRKYLLLDGHFEHENIVSAFQTYFNDDIDNILYLIASINKPPAFHSDESMRYPYIRKCIYAIGAQPGPDNLAALNILSASNDREISDLARHQIDKRKKNGQWEKEK